MMDLFMNPWSLLPVISGKCDMTRVIEPDLSRLDFLPTPLNDGERRVLEFFDRHLPVGWEIYIQPHLNGLQPDFVVLHPEIGIGVFEVKDWNFQSLRYFASEGQLWAQDRGGKKFWKDDSNPVKKVRRYKQAIMDLYCAGLEKGAGFGRIAAGVIFTQVPRREALNLCRGLRNKEEERYSGRHPVAGIDTLEGGYLNQVLPLAYDKPSEAISDEAIYVFRGWLREPYSAREQYEPISLDRDQRAASDTRTPSGFRRLRGPAGSGKTEVAARRAALLTMEDKRVLVACFNITMMNYLRDAVARHIRFECGLDERRRFRAMRKFEVMYVHRWVSDCWELLKEAGQSSSTNDFESEQINDVTSLCATCGTELELADLNQAMCEECLSSHIWRNKLEAVIDAYGGDGNDSRLPAYDAVIADEGQDLTLEWWKCMSSAVRFSGERLLVVDKTQNVYGRAKAWTDDVMNGAGFRGRWAELKSSYRLPSSLLPVLRDYADLFLKDEDIDIPETVADHDLFGAQCKLRWIQLTPGDPSGAVVCADELDVHMRVLPDDMANSDCVILSQSHAMGEMVVSELRGRGLKVLELFDPDQRETRRKKLRFYKGAPMIKASTIHSYKGWESRQLVVWVRSIESTGQKCLFYVALTRLLGHVNGSSLTVVCEEPRLREFGRRWFHEFGGCGLLTEVAPEAGEFGKS